MKLNRPFFVNTALTAILLTLATLSANAREYSEQNYVEVRGALAAEPYGEDHSDQNSDKRFISQQTTKMEFALAILIVTVGLVASEILQRNQEQQ